MGHMHTIQKSVNYVPLAYGSRYFILQPGKDRPLVSVLCDASGGPAFEIVKSQKSTGQEVDIMATPEGGFIVRDKTSGAFCYSVVPATVTRIVLGGLPYGPLDALIQDNGVIIGDTTYSYHEQDGSVMGVEVFNDASVQLADAPRAELVDYIERNLITTNGTRASRRTTRASVSNPRRRGHAKPMTQSMK